MKKLISIVVLLAMLMSAIIMTVPAGADETENDPSVNPDIQYFVFPHPFLEGSIDGAHLNKEEYLELLKENIPAIGEINLEFYEEFPEFLWPDYMTEFDREHLENSYTGFPIPSYPEESLDYSNHKDKDRCYIVSCKDGFFVILYTSKWNDEPDPTPIPDPRSIHEWADYYWRFIEGPFSSDEWQDKWISLNEKESEGLFDELPDEYLPLIANDINKKREHAIQTGDADPDEIISGEEFAERLRDSLEIGCFIHIDAGEYGYAIIRRYNGQFEVIKGKPYLVTLDAEGTPIETDPAPVETESAPVETEPVETEPAPGTGGTEPVVAPKTVDRLALIAGALIVSLTLCAAAFTVVKAKKR